MVSGQPSSALMAPPGGQTLAIRSLQCFFRRSTGDGVPSWLCRRGGLSISRGIAPRTGTQKGSNPLALLVAQRWCAVEDLGDVLLQPQRA